MEKRNFSIGETLQFGLKAIKENLGTVLLLTIITFASILIATFITAIGIEINEILGVILLVVPIGVSLLLGIGLIKMGLMICDGEKVPVAILFTQYRYIPKFLLVMVLYLIALILVTVFIELVTILGIILLLPILYFGIRFMFFQFEIIDKNAGPISSLTGSFNLTKGFIIFIKLLAIALIFIVLNFISTLLEMFLPQILGGIIGLVIALFLTPFQVIVTASIYRNLSGKPSEEEAEEDLFAEEEEFEEEELEEFEEEEGEFGEEKE